MNVNPSPDRASPWLAQHGLEILATAVLLLDRRRIIVYANPAAENLFELSARHLVGHAPAQVFAPSAGLDAAIDKAVAAGAAYSEQELELGVATKPPLHLTCTVSPVDDDAALLLEFRHIDQQLKIAREERLLEQQQANRELIRSLAHEIKNPLGGIRGAAQLLEQSAGEDDRTLTRLICEEADRIVKLVDRMEVFTDERPIERQSVNIHSVLEHVKRLAHSGYARHIKFVEDYDPSLPPVLANRDQLIQVFLNLTKNAAEAIGEDTRDGEIQLTTAFRPGVRLSLPGSKTRVSLPLEFCVRDNGPGVPDDLLAHLFDPFVTTKPKGSGLGLALAAKIVGDHGGIIECESQPRRTTFRVLMPMFLGNDAEPGGAT